MNYMGLWAPPKPQTLATAPAPPGRCSLHEVLQVPIPALSTRRLDLRPAVAEDLGALWALWRDPDVRRYLFDDVPVTRERSVSVRRHPSSGVRA